MDNPREHAEAQLRLNEERFRHIFENAAVGIAEVAIDGRFAAVNDTFCQIAGYERAELLDRRFHDITHPDDLAADLKQAMRLVAGELQTYTMEKRYVRKDGVPVHVNLTVSAVRRHDGKFAHFIAIVDDISERRAAEEALRRSEQQFRSVFKHAATGIAITTLSGEFVECNQAYEAIVGYSHPDLMGRRFPDLVHPDDRAENVRQIDRLCRGEVDSFELENRYVRRDGTPVWVHKFVSVLHDANARPSAIMALVTDITHARATHDAQREAMRQKDEFIAVLAHELRNPLAPIRTSVDTLRNLLPPDPVLHRCREVIDRQVGHMARLIDDLLDVSRLSRGEFQLKRRPTQLASVIEDAIELTHPLLIQQHQTLSVEGLDDSLCIDADAARLTQVIGNILNNASKYSPAGSEIQVVVEQTAHDVAIRVRDLGVGIPAIHLERVFTLFEQSDSARALGKGGMGIGLALARQLVEMHGGRIEATSPGPGLGSEFIVTLPKTRDQHASPPEQSAGADDDAWTPLRRRVLVADDNVDAAEMLAVLFEQLECQVTTVHDGDAAIREAERFRPEVVVLDIGMPGMDGYEVCRQIRREPWGQSMLIVALTGWGNESDRRRSLEAGFDHHFVKPLDTAALIRRILHE
jgi:PAS domain S-box-containing protein